MEIKTNENSNHAKEILISKLNNAVCSEEFYENLEYFEDSIPV